MGSSLTQRLLGLGVLVAGREVLRYAYFFNRWVARVLVEAMIGSPPKKGGQAERTNPGEKASF